MQQCMYETKICDIDDLLDANLVWLSTAYEYDAWCVSVEWSNALLFSFLWTLFSSNTWPTSWVLIRPFIDIYKAHVGIPMCVTGMIDWVGFSCPTKHIIGHIGDGFLRVKWPNRQCQSTEGSSSPKDRLQSHQVHLTMLQAYACMQYIHN